MKRLLFSILTLLSPFIVIAKQSERPQHVVFKVTPITATVVVDGKSAVADSEGFAIFTLTKGSHKYIVFADGYRSETGLVSVEGYKIVKNIELKLTCGLLNVSYPKEANGAKVFVDGNHIGMLPIKDFKLTSGIHTINIEHDQYKVYEDKIIVSEGEILNYKPTLTPRIGTLNITSTPAMSNVYIDDKLVGETPIMVDITVGKHQVSVLKDSFGAKSQSVVVSEGGIVDVKFTLIKQTLENEIEDDKPFVKVEQMPSFMGGDLMTFRNWVMSKIRIPQIAIENRISGQVLLSFAIERDGSLSNIQVLRSPHSSLSEEAIRVLKQSPKWTPGKQRNQPVRVKYTLPIEFRHTF